MKYTLLLRFLCTSILTFAIGYGSVACLATGLDLCVNLTMLALFCAIGATLAASCLCKKKDVLILSGLYLVACIVICFSSSFRREVGSIIHLATTNYNKYYGMPIPQWTLDHSTQSHLFSLLMIAGCIMITVLLTITYQRGTLAAILAAFLPLSLCIFAPNTTPDFVPLFMLLFGILLLVLSGSVRNRDIDQGNVFTAIVLLPLSAAIILLAILVPPDSYRNSGIYSSVNKFMDYLDAKFSDSSLNPTESSSTSNTLQNDVDLSQLGDRTEIDTSVMTITTNYDGRVYIRNQDFDLYTGLGWKSSENRIENDYVLTTVWRDAPEFITIKLSQTQNRYFLPCYPTQVQNLTGGIMLNLDRVTQYTLSFSQIRPDWRELWYAYNQDHTTAPEIPAADNRYLALSDDTKQRAQAILSQLSLLSSDDPVSAADIICEYVSKSAAYSTVPSKMPQSETDFSMWFLESGNAGYCTHFASAAVVLLRAAGIPARYVEGYLVQTMQNQEVVVREDMSHAWVECYLDYVGWVIMDPTPTGSSSPSDPSAPSNSPVGTTPPDTTEPPITVPSTTTPPNTSIPGETAPPRPSTTTPTTTTAPPSETKNPEDSSLIGNQTQAPKNKNMLPTVLIWAVCCLAVLILQWVARRILIKIWLRHGSANIKAIKKYRYSQYLTRIIKVEYPAYLSELASKAAFSQYEIDDKETQAFDDYILKQTKAIRSLPLIRRFLLRFIYAVY